MNYFRTSFDGKCKYDAMNIEFNGLQVIPSFFKVATTATHAVVWPLTDEYLDAQIEGFKDRIDGGNGCDQYATEMLGLNRKLREYKSEVRPVYVKGFASSEKLAKQKAHDIASNAFVVSIEEINFNAKDEPLTAHQANKQLSEKQDEETPEVVKLQERVNEVREELETFTARQSIAVKDVAYAEAEVKAHKDIFNERELTNVEGAVLKHYQTMYEDRLATVRRLHGRIESAIEELEHWQGRLKEALEDT